MILFCNCSNSDIIEKKRKKTIIEFLEKSQISFTFLDDLCGSIIENKEMLKDIAKDANIYVIACYPRAIKSLLSNISIIPTDVFNMRNQSTNEIIKKLNNINLSSQDIPSQKSIGKPSSWRPWYPVIDYDKCTNCKQCMNFCLFGVYIIDENNQIKVQNPQNCKNNCPACARVCPEVAIIFPKHNDSPINGDEIVIEHIEVGKAKVNVEEVLGDDLYSVLKNRKPKNKIPLLKEKAYIEREKCSCSCNSKKN